MFDILKTREFSNFIAWSFKKRPIEIVIFFLNKLVYKTISQFKHSWYFYPPQIRKKFQKIPVILKGDWKLPCFNNSIFGETSSFKLPEFIQLATCKIDIRNGISWKENFIDNEDTEFLHRWNWLLVLLSEEKNEYKQLLGDWGKTQIISWFKAHPHSKNGPAWESYTVGERISNSVIFLYFTSSVPTEEITTGLVNQMSYLIRHLEYFGKYTSNHIFNNARAIFLAGCAFGIKEWKDFASTIIYQEIALLVTRDGFLREGSSHYQLLFTRWVLEIIFFARLVNYDETFVIHLNKIAEQLVEKSVFFVVENNKKNEIHFPLIGDISPDFSPQWCAGILPKVFKEKLINKNWGQIFNINYGTSQYAPTRFFPDSGWLRINWLSWTLILHTYTDNAPEVPGHFHADLTSFVLFKEGCPILVDSGRYSYQNDTLGKFGLSASAHNSVCIDNLGLQVLPWATYPKHYICSRTIVSIQEEQNGLCIVNIPLSGFNRLIKPASGNRKLFLSKNAFRIIDEVKSGFSHNFDFFFHFSPEIILSEKSAGNYCFSVAEKNVKAVFSSSPDTATFRKYHGDDTPHGWFINQYGVKTPKTCLKISISDKNNVFLKTEFTIQ